MKGFGGMISIELGAAARAKRFAEHTRIFALAESLGGVESLVGHPASMTHASVPPERRRAMGLTDSLVRLSVGIEDVERSEEHTSELQSRLHLVCRLLLEKKKKKKQTYSSTY